MKRTKTARPAGASRRRRRRPIVTKAARGGATAPAADFAMAHSFFQKGDLLTPLQGNSQMAEIAHSTLMVDGHTHHVIVMPADTERFTTALLEPFTWAWIAVKICEGILEAIGAKIFVSLFGSDSVTKTDLNDALKEFLSAVSQVVRQVLQEEEIEKLVSAAQGLQASFLTYITTSDPGWLIPIIQQADNLMAQCGRFPYQTIGAFATVGSLELAALQEGAKNASSEGLRNGYKLRLGSRASELVKIGDKILPALTSFNESRFSPVIHYGPSPAWFYVVDGNPVINPNDPYSREVAEQERQARIKYQLGILTQQIIAPFYPIADKWSEISKQ
jgi:hypothetical protein